MSDSRATARRVGDEAREEVPKVHDEMGRSAVSLLTDRYPSNLDVEHLGNLSFEIELTGKLSFHKVLVELRVELVADIGSGDLIFNYSLDHGYLGKCSNECGILRICILFLDFCFEAGEII